jgi:hypothetical protein
VFEKINKTETFPIYHLVSHPLYRYTDQLK